MSVSKKVLEDASREFDEELHREQVERYKEKLRHRRNFWVRVFPWRITIKIERREAQNFVSRTAPQHIFPNQCPCPSCKGEV